MLSIVGRSHGFLSVLIGIALLVSFAPVYALPGSSFEGNDGNLTVDTLQDWESFLGGGLIVGRDIVSGQDDDSFQGKEDDSHVEITYGSIPNNKSDLLRFYVAQERLLVEAVEKDFLYLAWVRANTLGSANMDFEFNQSTELSSNGVTPRRSVGDILVTFAFSSGGSQPDLGLSRWTETGPCESGNAPPCWGVQTALSGIAEGAVNAVATLDPVEGVLLEERTFGEAVIDLSLAGVFDQDSCVSFGRAFVKSRSSSSFTSSMKDFIQPIELSVSNCSTVQIVKDAVPDAVQAFDFSVSSEPVSAIFSLDDDGDNANSLPNRWTFEGKFSGAMLVNEQPAEGWDLSDVNCDVEALAERDGDGKLTGAVTLDVSTGSDVTCTFTNTKRGRIVVDVVTLPSGDVQTFDYLLSGGPDAISDASSLADVDAPHDFGLQRPGVYDLGQLDPGNGWDLTSASCDDDSPVDAVQLDPGETVTCTFVNTKRGRILVDQVTVPAGDEQLFDFSLTSVPESLSQGFGLRDADTMHDSDVIVPGMYLLVQTDAGDAWDLTSASCDDNSPVDAIQLDPGETVTCTFVNTKRGRILVDQVTVPAGDEQLFDFSLTSVPESLSQGFGLRDADTMHDSDVIVPGMYSIVQTDPGDAWDLTSASCDDNSPVDAIQLDPGETVTCTFVNTKRGRILVDQVTVPAGDEQLFDFSLTSVPESLSQGFGLRDVDAMHDSDVIVPGMYSIVQTDPGEVWDLTIASCDDNSPVDAVQLDPGETVTCTFVNTKRGRILVDQVTVPAGDEQLFDFSLTSVPESLSQGFGLRDVDAMHDSDVIVPGMYSIVQTDPGEAWDLTSASCDDNSPVDAVQLDPGETVTCTFVNTKRGRILVDQVTIPTGDEQLFDFSLTSVPETLSQGFGLRDADTMHDSDVIVPGMYSLVQTDPGEVWDLTSASCDDNSPVDAIQLDPGETVTCTFVNTKRGRILVDQVTVPAGDEQLFDFSLTSVPESLSQGFGLRDVDTMHDSDVIVPGMYSIVQTDPGDAWDLTSASCDDNSPVDAIQLDPGETVTCTFVNTKRGRILVDQVTVPAGDEQLFDFSLTSVPESLSQGFGLRDVDTMHDSDVIVPGMYSLVQTDPGEAWDLTSASCDDNSPVDAIQLDPGETVTCTFVNTKRSRVLVQKFVVNESTGTGFDPRNWPFQFDSDWTGGFQLRHGETHESPWVPGAKSYQISESAASGWVVSSSCELDGTVVASGGASIQPFLDAGAVVTCTFVNELQMHPGSAGFWRNWSNHYTEAQFILIAVEALSGSPIYEGLYIDGQPVPDFRARVDEFFATGSGSQSDEQPLLKELTTLILNLAVSKSEDPAIRSLQQQDDICEDCVIEVDETPGARALLEQWAECPLPDFLTIGDVIEAVEATWTGMMPETWEFLHLSPADQTVLTSLIGRINQGSNLVVDPSGYPDRLTCVRIEVPDPFVWYLDDDGDGHGQMAITVETCDETQPAGFAPTGDDCDDGRASVYPGAPEVCDGVNNDCHDASWPALTSIEFDDDLDGFTECGGDCDDSRSGIYPGAPEVCDGLANDCSSSSWPLAPVWDHDDDLDGITECGGDCDDASASVYPGAPQICDGANNDCGSPFWPDLPVDEVDADLDGVAACEGDCDDSNWAINPFATETCDGLDNDCSGIADDSAEGLDADGDGLAAACDSCPMDFDPLDADFDADGYGDVCDNCMQWFNPMQSDLDQDGEGDRCDENDGLVVLYAVDSLSWEWHAEPNADMWNLYRGDLDVLFSAGIYTQAPGSNALADAACGLTVNTWIDSAPVPSGSCAFYLVSEISDGVEGSIGADGEGAGRPNQGDCLRAVAREF